MIAPLGQLASGGARVLRVDVAVDDPVEAHRGGARARHRDDDAGDARDGKAVAARGDGRGGERERQREQRVLELDHPAEFHDLVHGCRGHDGGATQRKVGVGSRTSDSSGAAMSSTSTSSTPGRAPGVSVPNPRSPEAARAAARGGVQPARGRHRREVRGQRRHLAPTATDRARRRGCRCRSPARGRRRRSASTSGSRPPMCRFERGQSTTVAPASRAMRRSSAPAWTMCTSSGGVSVWNAPSDAR